MYEQYTDKQIVEMLVPKLKKSVPELDWDEYLKRPDDFSIWNHLISVIYKSGYIRGQLGRSFIIGEKKSEEKKAKESVNTFKVGDKVKFLGLSMEDEAALSNRRDYPPVNTVGEVVDSGLFYCVVRWPKNTTYGDGACGCRNSYLEKVTEHWVPVTEMNLKPGVKVRYLNAKKHLESPEFYPARGTVGDVVSVCNDNTCFVQWTGYTDAWCANRFDLEVLLCE